MRLLQAFMHVSCKLLRPWLANLMQKTHFWPTLQLLLVCRVPTYNTCVNNQQLILLELCRSDLIRLAVNERICLYWWWVSIYAMRIFTRQKLLGTLNFLFGFMCCKYLLLECLKLSFVAAENQRHVTQSTSVNLLLLVVRCNYVKTEKKSLRISETSIITYNMDVCTFLSVRFWCPEAMSPLVKQSTCLHLLTASGIFCSCNVKSWMMTLDIFEQKYLRKCLKAQWVLWSWSRRNSKYFSNRIHKAE